jgi:hypothetical protein
MLNLWMRCVCAGLLSAVIPRALELEDRFHGLIVPLLPQVTELNNRCPLQPLMQPLLFIQPRFRRAVRILLPNTHPVPRR